MSKSINRVELLGNIGQPPESHTSNGTLRMTVSLATNERKKVGDKWEDHTEWHRLVFFGRLAEVVRDYARKGSKIFVSGRLRTNSWEDEHQQKRWSTNIIADELILLDKAEQQQSSQSGYTENEGVPF